MKKNQTTFLKLCLADALIQLMDLQPYETISVHAICDKAGIGRTTYYRHLDKRTGKEDLIVFKVLYDQKVYNERHADAVKKDSGYVLLQFIYENKRLFSTLHKNGLVTVIMRIFDEGNDWQKEKGTSYLRAFFIYGYFGVIYEWIKYGFDETPEQVQRHIAETLMHAVENQQKKNL